MTLLMITDISKGFSYALIPICLPDTLTHLLILTSAQRLTPALPRSFSQLLRSESNQDRLHCVCFLQNADQNNNPCPLTCPHLIN